MSQRRLQERRQVEGVGKPSAPWPVAKARLRPRLHGAIDLPEAVRVLRSIQDILCMIYIYMYIYIILRYIILYYIILYYIILYYITLYHIISYYITLYISVEAYIYVYVCA